MPSKYNETNLNLCLNQLKLKAIEACFKIWNDIYTNWPI